MSVQAQVYEAFVSSPQDVAKERALVTKVLTEINAVYIRDRILVWPVMCENLAHGRGVDPQEVINRQVETYDIFVGILWSRFGTPTKRAGSGTEEEFLQAFRLADRGHPVRFLVFNRASELPANVDEDQLKRVREFRKLINKSGVLPHDYEDFAEFEELFRREILLYLN